MDNFEDLGLDLLIGGDPDVVSDDILDAPETRDEAVDTLIKKITSQESHLSYSALINFAKSPRHFIEYKLRKKERTPAMIFGSMLHCLVLEPDKFEERYFLMDDTEIIAQIGGGNPRGTKAYKEWKAGELEEAQKSGKEVVMPPETLKARLMASQVNNNYVAAKKMSKCEFREVKLEFKYGGYSFMGFVDAMGDAISIDLKSCPDADPRKFQRKVIDMGYHIQGALYGIDMPDHDFYNIAVDGSGNVSVHQYASDLLNFGREKLDLLLAKFNECVEKNLWHLSHEFWAERGDGVFVADRPAWTY